MKSQDELDIFKCSAPLAHETRHLRETLTLKDNHVEEISSKCSSAIVRLVNALELFPKHTNETKLFYHTVGLLYLMRQGITCNNTALLTRMSILKNILPQENHIKAVFNVRAKVITETENMVKMCMRKLSSIHDIINIHYSIRI